VPELLLLLLVLSFPVCCLVALGLAIGARRRIRDAEGHWRRRVNALELRVRDLETRAPAAAPPRPAPEPPAPAPVPLPELELAPPAGSEAPEPQPAPAARSGPPPTLPELHEIRTHGPSLEERIGGSWFNWVGILAIVFGVAYAMKYSFEQGWVTPVMRFWGGLVLGVLLLAAGAFSDRRSYGILARGFWGGGIGILFVVFFAGFKLLLVDGHPMIGRGTAFAGMALTVAAGTAIAIVFDTRTTAVLSALGGYLTPLLLRTGVPDQIFLFTYLLILTGGLLFLGYWKRWGFLRILTFTAVVLYFAGWWATEGTGVPWAMLIYPSLFFLFFVTEIAAWSVWRRVADSSASYVVLGLATTLHALSGLHVLDVYLPAYKGVFLLATALYLILGARLIARRHAEDRPLADCYGYAAGLLFLLIPVFEARIHGWWMSCAWAVQGVALFLGEDVWGARGRARLFGYAAFAAAAGRLLAYDTPTTLADIAPYAPFWNARVLAFAIVGSALTFGSWRARRLERAGNTSPEAHVAATCLWVVTLSLPVVLLSLELAQGLRVYVTPRYGGATRAYQNQASHWMTLLWAAYATLAATVMGRRGLRILRDAAAVFGAFVVVHFVVRGLAATYVTQATPLLNSRFGASLGIALCLAWCAREYRLVAARGAAHLFLLAGLCMEWVDLCLVRGIGGDAEWFGMTILVAAYGTGLVLRGAAALRPLGAAFAALAAAKFLLIDLVATDANAAAFLLQPRFAAAVAATAACLLAGSRPFPRPIPTLLRLCGHAVAVSALTVETLDLFTLHGWNDVLPEAWYAVIAVWAAYGAVAMEVGHVRERPHLRGLAVVLLGSALLVGLVFLVEAHRAPRLFLNTRAMGLGVTALALLLSAEPYRRRGTPGAPLPGEGAALGAALALAGHGTVMLLLTLEAADRFHLAGSEEHMRQLSYSLIWTVYAIGMVTGGFLRRYRPVRLMALAVLVGTIVKVFVFDLSFLENPYRILSFLALGAVLVAVSFLYHKYRHVLA